VTAITTHRPATEQPLRHNLATTLRNLRQDRSLRLVDVADRLGITPSTLSRIETGLAPTRTSYLTIMLDMYGIDDRAERARLTHLAREAQRKPWWYEYRDLLTPGTGQYLDLETAAASISTYTAKLVPDLLQTPAYTAAAIKATRPDLGPDSITKLVTLQTRRQERIIRAKPTLHAILDSTTITNPIAPAHVMTDQLAHLITTAVRPGITVQLTSPAAHVISTPFTLLSFADEPGDSGISCCQAPAGHVIIDRKHSTMHAIRALFDRLVHSARSSDETAELLRNSV
jgi:transcriptional regulator with XRE-family HTH domain